MCREKLIEDKKGCTRMYARAVVVSVASSRVFIPLPLFLRVYALNGAIHFQ